MNNNLIRKILYIEDDPEVIDLVTLILNRNGYTLTSTTDGYEGLLLAKSILPDVILLDLMIPDIDGWEILKQLKANETTSNIPIIIITAKSQTIDRVLGIHVAHADGYICKPFHPQELLSAVEAIFSRNI